MTDDPSPAGGRAVPPARTDRGRRNWQAGHAAEDAVARDYAGRGYAIAARRVRGAGAEIDLIARDPSGATVFVEVKRSRTHAAAAESLRPAQMARLCDAALVWLEARGETGAEMRFDAALVDGAGRIEILENAFGA